MDALEQLEENFKIYDNRVAEFNLYLEKSTSQTQNDLINSALSISDRNLHLLRDLLKVSVDTLAILDAKIKSKSNQANLDLEKLTNKFDQVKHDPDLMKKFLPEFHKTEKEISARLANVGAETLLFNATQLSTQEFQRVLFNCIYLPNNEQFKLDIILELLKSIIIRMIPHADVFETISNLSISKRKRVLSSSSDKFLTYLENYINASELWQVYSNKYLEWLRND